ncbi:MAG: hypothetical protein M1833_006482 [Piccolia ochrophora]|nr:MAG: hypothetical protein M1833_006482 [Piccolia ochrophora]
MQFPSFVVVCLVSSLVHSAFAGCCVSLSGPPRRAVWLLVDVDTGVTSQPADPSDPGPVFAGHGAVFVEGNSVEGPYKIDLVSAEIDTPFNDDMTIKVTDWTTRFTGREFFTTKHYQRRKLQRVGYTRLTNEQIFAPQEGSGIVYDVRRAALQRAADEHRPTYLSAVWDCFNFALDVVAAMGLQPTREMTTFIQRTQQSMTEGQGIEDDTQLPMLYERAAAEGGPSANFRLYWSVDENGVPSPRSPVPVTLENLMRGTTNPRRLIRWTDVNDEPQTSPRGGG